MITRALLRSLRNDLPMDVTLRQLGERGPDCKSAEGRLRFVCPHCEELDCAVNPRNNLAHCFNCGRNINNIDLLIATGFDFRSAVEQLQRWLLLFQNQQTHHRQGLADLFSSSRPHPPSKEHGSLGAILHRTFEKNPPETEA